MSRFINLPESNLTFDVDRVIGIVRQEINEFAIIMDGCPVMLKITGKELDLFNAFASVEKLELPKVLH